MQRNSGLEDLSVKEIMDRWPETIGAFISRRMHCVGCPIGSFHTLADAAGEHKLDSDALLEAIQIVVRADPERGRRQSAGAGGGSSTAVSVDRLPPNRPPPTR